MRAKALEDQAVAVGTLEEAVTTLSEQVDRVLAVVTEIYENLQGSQGKPAVKVKAKTPQSDAE
jgi:tRNA A-37 threonylcarbamoyl transferase component Bud32